MGNNSSILDADKYNLSTTAMPRLTATAIVQTVENKADESSGQGEQMQNRMSLFNSNVIMCNNDMLTYHSLSLSVHPNNCQIYTG